MNERTREVLERFGEQGLLKQYEAMLTSPAWLDFVERARALQAEFDSRLHNGKAADEGFIAKQQQGYDTVYDILALPAARMKELTNDKGEHHA